MVKVHRLVGEKRFPIGAIGTSLAGKSWQQLPAISGFEKLTLWNMGNRNMRSFAILIRVIRKPE